MATSTVTNLDKSGAGSLPRAIYDDNAAAAADSIAFDPSVDGIGLTLIVGEWTIFGRAHPHSRRGDPGGSNTRNLLVFCA